MKNNHHLDFKFLSVEEAIEQFQIGKPIIMVDDENRENEGDIVMPAEFITPEWINFMGSQARGLICTPLTPDYAKKLQLTPMVTHNTSDHETAFTVSIDAAQNISTGISSFDRSHTIKLLTEDKTLPQDFVRPGHIFPLISKDGGVLTRAGHTEASTDLCLLAKLIPVAVICEIMNEDGSMSRMDDLKKLSLKWNMGIITIKAIQDYRWKNESILKLNATSILPTHYGQFHIHHYINIHSKEEVTVLESDKKLTDYKKNPLIRIHSSCLTGEAFHSLRCDCGYQLQLAMQEIAQQGGLLIYLFQEGRGIGLGDKIKAYHLQDNGHDTITANIELGHRVDERQYENAFQVLKKLNISECRLLTNNPEKAEVLKEFGIKVTTESFAVPVQEHNKNYLFTKVHKMNHSPQLINDLHVTKLIN